MDGLHNGLRPQPLLGTWKAPGPFRPQILLKALRDRGVPRWTTWSSGASRATLALALAAVPHWRGTARRVAHHAVAPGAADWAAPVAVARSAAGEVELALGAVEQLVDGTRRGWKVAAGRLSPQEAGGDTVIGITSEKCS